MKAWSGRWSHLPSQSSSNERMVSSSDVRCREAGELLGDVERLGEEALDLAGATDDQLVLLGQLVDAEDGDDVLQVLVALQDLLHLAGDLVVLSPTISGATMRLLEASGSTAG